MPNFKLTLEYNGEDFFGSQIQNRAVSLGSWRVAKRTSSRLRRTNDRSVPSVHEDHEDDENAEIGVSLHAHSVALDSCKQARYRRTVQDELEKALTIYFRSEERILTNFSSRTDAGVHALGQVLNFKVPVFDLANPEKFLIGLNGILPRDISVVKVELVSDDFDARFSATAREYMYKIFTRRHRPVLRLDSLLWVKEPLNFNAMQLHAGKFLGEHDFTNYYRSELYLKNPICNITKSELIREGKYCFKYYISANRFLRNMVRRIVAEIIEVGKQSARGMGAANFKPNLKECPSECVAGAVLATAKTAPANALTLLRVEY